jgi:hypothetical protein
VWGERVRQARQGLAIAYKHKGFASSFCAKWVLPTYFHRIERLWSVVPNAHCAAYVQTGRTCGAYEKSPLFQEFLPEGFFLPGVVGVQG